LRAQRSVPRRAGDLFDGDLLLDDSSEEEGRI